MHFDTFNITFFQEAHLCLSAVLLEDILAVKLLTLVWHNARQFEQQSDENWNVRYDVDNDLNDVSNDNINTDDYGVELQMAMMKYWSGTIRGILNKNLMMIMTRNMM